MSVFDFIILHAKKLFDKNYHFVSRSDTLQINLNYIISQVQNLTFFTGDREN